MLGRYAKTLLSSTSKYATYLHTIMSMPFETEVHLDDVENTKRHEKMKVANEETGGKSGNGRQQSVQKDDSVRGRRKKRRPWSLNYCTIFRICA